MQTKDVANYRIYCLKVLNSYPYVKINDYNRFINESMCETFIDLETSGLGKEGQDYILEIYALKRGLDGEIIGSFHTYVKDKNLRDIPKEVSDINKITMSTIQYAPSTFEVLSALKMFLQNDIIIAHNSAFDWSRFLKRDFQRLGIYCNNIVLCTYQLSKKIYTGLDSYKLSSLAEFLGIDYNQFALHGAKADVALMISVYEDLKEPDEKDSLKNIKKKAYKEHFEHRKRIKESESSNYDYVDFTLERIDTDRQLAVVKIQEVLYDLYFNRKCYQWDLSALSGGISYDINGKAKCAYTFNIDILLLNQLVQLKKRKGA